jgi:hypothetical protein
MLTTKVVTKTELAQRQKTRDKWSSKRGRNKAYDEAIMAKMNVTLAYLKAIEALKDRIAEEQTMSLISEGSKAEGAVVAIEVGRVFDKILVGTISPNMTMKDMEPRYFVERASGDIYGAKSNVAAQRNWFFGNLSEIDAWDWSGFHAVPKDMDMEALDRDGIAISETANVAAKGKYGKYITFERLTDAHRKAVKKAAKGHTEMAAAEK